MFPSRKRLAQQAGLFFITSALVACATYQGKVGDARNLLENGQYSEAVEKLKPLAEKADGDQLVYMLDYAVALQLAGNLKESNAVLIRADRLADEIDYHSASRIAGSMLLNEEMKQYKGDTFEKIFINAFLAMNFLEMNQLDDALVESRRMNEKYLKYRADEKKKFEQNVFGKYLSAMVWEANRQFDDAYIAYAEAYELDPSIPSLRQDLVRISKLARRSERYKEWKAKFPEVKDNPSWYDSSQGELVVIFQQGWGPRKAPTPGSAALPTLRPVYNTTQAASLKIDGQGGVHSQLVYDVQSAAIQTLADDHASLVARRIGAFATKEVLADQLRQKNEALGALALITMHLSERADLRQWSTLPQSIQTIRIPLKPGAHSISIQGLDSSGGPTADILDKKDIQIKAGRKTFVIWRSFR